MYFFMLWPFVAQELLECFMTSSNGEILMKHRKVGVGFMTFQFANGVWRGNSFPQLIVAHSFLGVQLFFETFLSLLKFEKVLFL